MIGDKLKNLREKMNYKKREMALALNMPYTTYCNYEAGSREPEYSTLIKIAEYFNVSTSELLGTGVFAQKELIIEIREPITYAMKELLGEGSVEILNAYNDDDFIRALSFVIDKVDCNKDTGELAIYYYLSSNKNEDKHSRSPDNIVSLAKEEPAPEADSLEWLRQGLLEAGVIKNSEELSKRQLRAIFGVIEIFIKNMKQVNEE